METYRNLHQTNQGTAGPHRHPNGERARGQTGRVVVESVPEIAVDTTDKQGEEERVTMLTVTSKVVDLAQRYSFAGPVSLYPPEVVEEADPRKSGQKNASWIDTN